MNRVGAIAENLISKADRNPFVEVFADWRDIVGAEIADILTPYKVTTILGRNLLVLKANDGCMTELQHQSMQIIDLLNQHFKSKIFSVIRVIKDINDL